MGGAARGPWTGWADAPAAVGEGSGITAASSGMEADPTCGVSGTGICGGGVTASGPWGTVAPSGLVPAGLASTGAVGSPEADRRGARGRWACKPGAGATWVSWCKGLVDLEDSVGPSAASPCPFSGVCVGIAGVPAGVGGRRYWAISPENGLAEASPPLASGRSATWRSGTGSTDTPLTCAMAASVPGHPDEVQAPGPCRGHWAETDQCSPGGPPARSAREVPPGPRRSCGEPAFTTSPIRRSGPWGGTFPRARTGGPPAWRPGVPAGP